MHSKCSAAAEVVETAKNIPVQHDCEDAEALRRVRRGHEVLFKTCVGMKFVDDDDDGHLFLTSTLSAHQGPHAAHRCQGD